MPRAFTPAQIRQLPLIADVVFEFAADKERAEYEWSLAKGRDPSTKYRKRYTKELSPGLQALSGLIDHMSAATYRATQEGEFRSRLRRAVVEGRYAAYGEEVAPTPSLRPHRIPAHLFDGAQIDWDRSELTSGGFVYRNVRVVRMDVLKAKTGHPKKGGRPTHKWRVWAALRMVERRDAAEFRRMTKAQKRYEAYKVLRHYRRELFETEEGLSQSAMARHVNSYPQRMQ